ncbi:hypothetical protein CBI38_33725 (plasmid) [Rhodococcus oxybenzonivorans]|uniref:Polyprenyl synthetase family protein n=1 Tax=Rhodococcus oxybenzonivorans TaxID=1990687 RepID=A0A2S2C6E8_9NOCA|nr:hypothetical protein CBI38_33725 [Rhodococcus oxybenzonivorans]
MNARLEGVLLGAVRTADPAMSTMAAVLLRRGGKRLRPTLLRRCAELGDADDDIALRAAAVVELLHVASLHHDDVMDEASIRRGGSSANALWGDETAALVGTHIMARATALLAGLPPDVVASVADTTFVVCTGQLRETEHAYDLDLDLDTYIDILRMKTASLFELPCRIGAMLAGLEPSQVDAVARYGSNLGIAFQLIDDLLDFEGETTALGKPTGTDLDRGIYSYPVLFALREPTGATLRERLGASETVGAAAELVRASGAPTATGELAREYSDRADRKLDLFPDTAARSALRALTDLVIARDR